MWKCPTKGAYIVIQRKDMNVVCPSEDIRPHNIKSAECECNPEVHYSYGVHVVHNRMDEQEIVDRAINKLFTK